MNEKTDAIYEVHDPHRADVVSVAMQLDASTPYVFAVYNSAQKPVSPDENARGIRLFSAEEARARFNFRRGVISKITS